MSDEETQLMAKYGITSESKTVFFYREHKYAQLQDALNYAAKTEGSETPGKTRLTK